jgi:gluconokinase
VAVACDAIVVMGVAGSGKTTVGMALAEALHWEFADADDFHSAENREKMAAGTPLTDDDRAPWLKTIRQYIADRVATGAKVVIACSALKETYREHLKPPAPVVVSFVYLNATPELTASRLRARHAHFMKVNMLASQYSTLEAPSSKEAITVDASKEVDEIVAAISRQLPKS